MLSGSATWISECILLVWHVTHPRNRGTVVLPRPKTGVQQASQTLGWPYPKFINGRIPHTSLSLISNAPTCPTNAPFLPPRLPDFRDFHYALPTSHYARSCLGLRFRLDTVYLSVKVASTSPDLRAPIFGSRHLYFKNPPPGSAPRHSAWLAAIIFLGMPCQGSLPCSAKPIKTSTAEAISCAIVQF